MLIWLPSGTQLGESVTATVDQTLERLPALGGQRVSRRTLGLTRFRDEAGADEAIERPMETIGLDVVCGGKLPEVEVLIALETCE